MQWITVFFSVLPRGEAVLPLVSQAFLSSFSFPYFPIINAQSQPAIIPAVLAISQVTAAAAASTRHFSLSMKKKNVQYEKPTPSRALASRRWRLLQSDSASGSPGDDRSRKKVEEEESLGCCRRGRSGGQESGGQADEGL